MRDGRDIVGNIEIRPYRGQEAGISVKSVAGEENTKSESHGSVVKYLDHSPIWF